MSSSLPWLAAGFGIAWVLIGLYVVRLWRAQRDIGRKLDEFQRYENVSRDRSKLG